MAANTKVLVIGADSMEKDLILKWIEEGRLPNFKALKERSVWGLSDNPPRRYSGAVWPCFYTGVNPDTHGQYIHTAFNTETYEFKGVRPPIDQRPPFWADPSMADKKIAIFNLTYAPLSKDLNGLQVMEWGVHDMHNIDGRDYDFDTYPPELKNTIIEKYGLDPVGPTDIIGRSAEGFVDFRETLVARVENKCALACDTLKEGEWDLFITTFDECHTVGHQCWHLHDPNHPLHDEIERDIGDPILDVFVAIDDAIGRIIECAGEDVFVLFLGSHGMGPLYDGTRILDDVLRQLEQKDQSTGVGLLNFLGRAWAALPSGLRNFLRPIRLKLGKKIFQSLTAGDRAARTCFTIPTQDLTAGIRVNLVGRESEGKINPGPEYEAFTNKLIDDLDDLVDGGTGDKAIEKISRTAEMDYGEQVGELPDLIVQWRVPNLTSIQSAKVEKIEAVYGSRKGDHKPWGIFFAAGPGIDEGELNEAVSVIDYAPTIAHILGSELTNVEGEVISRICPKAE